ncbi:type IV secretory pathway VirB4 component, ATPase TraC [Allomeiothermus silvanus DSM 9946]|uniref:Type IV secretory pathway VirB4 component, ATPase TraC n=1 Tax=Allomeiothermus silvanus (strain ATCC 700542 / DSM 9946 / NBRC 106475 / NCIMB 13440 / VI-R2) TaxID=526227 RepID=D7BA04_ALLS1|nr:TraC family protein [Allomeiothermus silvanus]ADH62438.1 type IV secretory pathway VirB4 component, ATPase TraC [Allomeiothermus silvanus DSM 9946]
MTASNVNLFNRPREGSLTEEFPYWEIHEGVMFLEDGRCEVGVELLLKPTLLLPQSELEGLLYMVRSVLRNGVPQGTRARLFVEAAPAPEETVQAYREAFDPTHPTARAIGEERYRHWRGLWERGEVMGRRAFLTVAYGHKRPRRLPFGGAELTERVKEGAKIRERIRMIARGRGVEVREMDSQEVFGLVYRYLNPGLRQAGVPRYRPTWQRYPRRAVERMPGLRPPTLRTQLLRSEVDNSRRDALYVGGRWLSLFTLYTIPDETYTEMGDVLALAGGGEFYLVVDFHHEPYERALKALKARARRFYAASANTETYVDPNILVGQRESEGAIAHISQTGDHVYRVGVALILIEHEREALERRASQVVGRLAEIPGNPFRQLKNGLFEPWKSRAPFSGGTSDEVVSLLESNAADLVPLTGAWKGHDKPVVLFHNRFLSLTRFDPFTPTTSNWNGIIAGGSGSGKTFFTQYVLADLLRRDEVDVVILDRGRNYEALVEAFGGAFIDIRPGGETAVNMFDLEEGEAEPGPEKLQDVLRFLRAILPPGEDRTEEAVENAILEAAIEQTYKRATPDLPQPDGSYRKVYQGARLSDLVQTLVLLDEVGSRPASSLEKEVARKLALRLQSWVGESPKGQFLDWPTSVPLAQARVVCYELEGLKDDLEIIGTLLIADLVWKRAKKGQGRRVLVVLDEAWKVFQSPYASRLIEELYRRFRFLGGGIWSITQSLADFAGEGPRALLQNTSFHFLLRLSRSEAELAVMRDVLGMPDRAIAVHERLTGVKGVYSEVLAWIRTGEGKEGEVIAVRPSPVDYWLFTSTREEVERRREATRRYGDVIRAVRALAYGEET